MKPAKRSAIIATKASDTERRRTPHAADDDIQVSLAGHDPVHDTSAVNAGIRWNSAWVTGTRHSSQREIRW
ncbi:hypothetical protein [Thermomonas sp.]|uniref:hypothetical protein n=1 Tax=Thermomonas sp. TaxID=1971895 RepID=UPI00260B2594|nr:hypothetical protein [Thermomonas sp.]MBL0227569.1 hypothetical protein [Thermomonas sp.]